MSYIGECHCCGASARLACPTGFFLLRGTSIMTARKQEAQRLQKDWTENPRWKGVRRGYGAEDVVRLRGSVSIDYTLAKRGAQRLWQMLATGPFVNSLGALTGNQAMQQVKAGLRSIYL